MGNDNSNNDNNNNNNNNNNLQHWLKKIEIECSTEFLQKAYLLGTAKIVRKVLDT